MSADVVAAPPMAAAGRIRSGMLREAQRDLRDRLARGPARRQEPGVDRRSRSSSRSSSWASWAAASARTWAARLPYAYLPFMLIGMIANTMYQGTITGVTNLVEERENDFTAELFVAPISRYAVLLGQDASGRRIAAMVSLVGIVAMIFVMQIPMDPGDLLRVLALTPILGARRRRARRLLHRLRPGSEGRGRRASPLLIFPQMFLSGALIPVDELDRPARRPVEDHADDLQHRPRPEHLLRGQARVRVRRAPPVLARPRRSRSACSSCSSSSGPCMFVRRDRNR